MFKIDGMCSDAFGKKYQVIKSMPVRGTQFFVVIVIGSKTTDQYIIDVIAGQGADIVNRRI